LRCAVGFAICRFGVFRLRRVRFRRWGGRLVRSTGWFLSRLRQAWWLVPGARRPAGLGLSGRRSARGWLVLWRDVVSQPRRLVNLLDTGRRGLGLNSGGWRLCACRTPRSGADPGRLTAGGVVPA